MTAYDHAYFEALYRRQCDPWDFATSAYERAKYTHTLASLPRKNYRHGLELGCSIGVLTEQLADRTLALTAVDTSTHALAQAQERLAARTHVKLVRAHLPDGPWQDSYDLMMLSEVLYYLDPPSLHALGKSLRACAQPGTDIVAVHWTGPTDYPLTAQEAVEGFEQAFGRLQVLSQQHTEHYRLDVWRVLS